MPIFKNKDQCAQNERMNIFSFVIPTYNEEKYIGALLEELFRLETDNFFIEIIVIDNGSCDDTLNIISKFPCMVYSLPDATIAEMRNYGVQKAQGRWIGFIDADCMPVKKWAVWAKHQLDNNEHVGVVGSFYSMSLNPTWVERLWCSMRHATTVGKVNFLPAGNMAVRHADFHNIGGFPANLITGEDYALCQKYIDNGQLIINNPELKNVHFRNVSSLLEIYKKELWYGLSFQKSFKDNLRSKVFWSSSVFLLGCLLVAIALFTLLVTSSALQKGIVLFGLLLVSFVVFFYALVATIRSRNILFFFGYLLIFFSYFLGRSMSIVKVLANKSCRSGCCKLK